MPLTQDTAIVTAAEVAELTHEDGLSNLNGTDATINNSCKWATNFIIPKLKLRGIQPEKVSNTSDLKLAACFIAAALALRGQPDEEQQKRAGLYLADGLAALNEYQFESIDGGVGGNVMPRGLPRALHVDRVRVFTRPTDNLNPSESPPHNGYLQK